MKRDITVTNFWVERLKDTWLKRRSTTAWKMVYLIVLKYNLDVKVRGFPAIDPARQLLENHKDKLTKEEIDFLEKVVKGEYIK